MSQRAKYLGQRSKVISFKNWCPVYTDARTHRTDRFTWTTRVVGNGVSAGNCPSSCKSCRMRQLCGRNANKQVARQRVSAAPTRSSLSVTARRCRIAELDQATSSTTKLTQRSLSLSSVARRPTMEGAGSGLLYGPELVKNCLECQELTAKLAIVKPVYLSNALHMIHWTFSHRPHYLFSVNSSRHFFSVNPSPIFYYDIFVLTGHAFVDSIIVSLFEPR